IVALGAASKQEQRQRSDVAILQASITWDRDRQASLEQAFRAAQSTMCTDRFYDRFYEHAYGPPELSTPTRISLLRALVNPRLRPYWEQPLPPPPASLLPSRYASHFRPPVAIASTLDGENVALLAKDGPASLVVYRGCDTAVGQPCARAAVTLDLGGPRSSIASLAFSPGGQYLAADDAGTLRVWDWRKDSSRECVEPAAPSAPGCIAKALRNSVRAFAFRPKPEVDDLSSLLIAYDDGTLRWGSGEAFRAGGPAASSPASYLAFSRDGDTLAAASAEATTFWTWDGESWGPDGGVRLEPADWRPDAIDVRWVGVDHHEAVALLQGDGRSKARLVGIDDWRQATDGGSGTAEQVWSEWRPKDQLVDKDPVGGWVDGHFVLWADEAAYAYARDRPIATRRFAEPMLTLGLGRRIERAEGPANPAVVAGEFLALADTTNVKVYRFEDSVLRFEDRSMAEDSMSRDGSDRWKPPADWGDCYQSDLDPSKVRQAFVGESIRVVDVGE
ncbi:MAG: hypothetical protein AAGE94_26435, partial [Acidobacteriota bacterium]